MKLTPALAAALTSLLAVAAPAGAADRLLTTTVDVGQAQDAACHDTVRTGSLGVWSKTVRPGGDGYLAARLTARGGDWDVGLFDEETGMRLGGGATPGAQELAEGFAAGSRRVVVQVCRRSGTARTAAVEVTNTELPATPPADRKAQLLEVQTPTRADKERLQSLGLDNTEHGGHDHIGIVAYGQRDLDVLRRNGFTWKVGVADLGEQFKAERRTELRAALKGVRGRSARARARAAALESGRTTYRTLADYENELKTLADRFPSLTRPITLAEKSVEGRAVTGIEITEGADDIADGKPTFLMVGVHHAREWPSAEHTMEFAHDLLNGFGRNERITGLVKRARTIIVPVINPDGFNISRSAPAAEELEAFFGGSDLGNSVYGPVTLTDPAFAYKRRNCRVIPGQQTPPGSCALPQFRNLGTDPNRNYGGLWGGPGASALPAWDTYRGPAPFSEPETRNVRQLVSSRQITTLITNHTFSNLVLRPPGVKAQGVSVDEERYRALGQSFVEQNGYANQLSYQLYDTTGTTEDWSYFATGGLGFTFEIGPQSFHPPYPENIAQYEGTGQFAGKGNREAYLKALENTANTEAHSLIRGRAPRGSVLKLTKEFQTETSPVRPAETDVVDNPQQPEGDVQRFKDSLESRLVVGSTDRFIWSVNPSTRPIVAERTLPSTAARRTEKLTAKKQTQPNPVTEPGPESIEEQSFTVTAEDAATVLDVTLTAGPADDYDIEVFRRGATGLESVGESGNLPGSPEQVTVNDPPVGEYVLRVKNYAAATPWEATVTRFGAGPPQVRPGVKEAYTLTCETPTGQLLGTQKVQVDRGQSVDVGEVCAGVNGGVGPQPAAGSVRGRNASVATCSTQAGFSRARAVARGSRVELQLVRRVSGKATIDVFRTSKGRRVVAEKRVKRFTGLTKAARLSGKGLADGVYFARWRVQVRKGVVDERRATLLKRRGRFTVRPTHYLRGGCGLVSTAKLSRPTFAGTSKRPLGLAFRVRRVSTVSVSLLRGKKVVSKRTLRGVKRNATQRVAFPLEGIRAGEYTVRIAASAGTRDRATVRLVSRAL